MAEARVVLIGVGNPLRGDDAAGLELAQLVAARVEPGLATVLEHSGEALDLNALLEPFCAAVIVDALRSGASPGTLRRFDLSSDSLPGELRTSTSTHAISLADALELARVLDRLPERVILHTVEGVDFAAGKGLSDAVRDALAPLADTVLDELRALALAP